MLALDLALAERSRLVVVRDRETVRAWELAVLSGCGLLAAAATIFVDLSLKIPGHAILRAVLPMSLGLALVPRRGAGLMMGGSALIGVLAAGLGGFSAGMGSTTSLLCLGPMLEIASRLVNRGWGLVVCFGAAALTSNLLAFAVRGAVRLGAEGARGSNSAWWSIAPVTYPLCGLLAGMLCAAIWFRWRSSANRPPSGAGS